MKLIQTNPPIRKRKPKPNPLDNFEPFLKLKAIVLGGTMAKNQQIGLLFDGQDVTKLKMKRPWRTAAERIRKTLRDAGLEREYNIVKYETDTPGTWFVRVTRLSGKQVHVDPGREREEKAG